MGENIAEFLRIVQMNRKYKWIFLHQKEKKVEIESTMSFCVERKDDAKKQNVDVNFSSITRKTMNIQHNLYCHYKRILAMT
jgi:hypothetical protein